MKPIERIKTAVETARAITSKGGESKAFLKLTIKGIRIEAIGPGDVRTSRMVGWEDLEKDGPLADALADCLKRSGAK